MGGADFSVTLWVSLFLFSIWGGGRLFGKLKLPPILGFFLIGILFGPAVFDVVPFASNGLCDSVVQPLAAAAASASASASGSATAAGRIDIALVVASRETSVPSKGSGSGSGGRRRVRLHNKMHLAEHVVKETPRLGLRSRLDSSARVS